MRNINNIHRYTQTTSRGSRLYRSHPTTNKEPNPAVEHSCGPPKVRLPTVFNLEHKVLLETQSRSIYSLIRNLAHHCTLIDSLRMAHAGVSQCVHHLTDFHLLWIRRESHDGSSGKYLSRVEGKPRRMKSRQAWPELARVSPSEPRKPPERIRGSERRCFVKSKYVPAS